MLHIFVYEKRTIMADTLLGDVEVPLAQLTEEDFLDLWLPLRSGGTHHKPGDAASGDGPPTAGWKVRVQVLLSFLLMCAKERFTQAAAVRAGRGGRGESVSALDVSGSVAGGVGGPAKDLGYDDDEEEEEGGEEEAIRATAMMDDLG